MKAMMMTGTLALAALIGGTTQAEAQQFRRNPRPNYGQWNGRYGRWNGGGYGGGFIYNRPWDGRPPFFNRPGDGLPPFPAYRLPDGRYVVNRPGDGLPPFVVGRPRW